MPQFRTSKTRIDSNELNRYEALRLQLAEIGNQFFEAARHYPGVHFQILQSDHSMGSDWWSSWIESHRTLDDWYEVWDVYPATWASSEWTLDDLDYMKQHTSQYCGLYKSVSGNLPFAIPELNRLSERANDVLFAVKKEVDEHQKLSRLASFSHLCPGYRGWLDSVRNTAELNRNAYVDVKTRMWGVPDDFPSVIKAMRSSMKEAKAALDRGISPPCGVVAFEIFPDVFTASGNAVRLWLEGGVAENIFPPTHNFDAISIRCMGSTDEATAILRYCGEKLPSIPQASTLRRPKKRGRTGLSEQERTQDKKIYENWMASGYKTYAEFALKNGYTLGDVKKRIEREQKRRKRREASNGNA